MQRNITRVVNIHKSGRYEVTMCDRSTIFGNPYSHKKGTKAKYLVKTRHEAVECFKRYFIHRLGHDKAFQAEVLKLQGKTLGCHCLPKECHVCVIADWLNGVPIVIEEPLW